MTNNQKFSFTEETLSLNHWLYGNLVLHRIKAECDIPRLGIKRGDLGGFIHTEQHLSVSGDAWVSGNAKVYGNAWVYGNAEVSGNAKVSGDAKVSGNAWVYGNAEVYGNAKVSGDAKVSGNAKVSGDAKVSNTKDYLVIGPVGSNRFITFTFSDQKVVAGCFRGSLVELQSRVKEKYGDVSDYYQTIKFLEIIVEEKTNK